MSQASFTPARLVLCAGLAYVLFLGSLSVAQHRGLRTQMHDLGNADQAIWDASRGHLAMIQTNTDDGRPRSRLGVHANLIFWLLALPYAFVHDPRLLLWLGTLACAAAGLGLYALSRHKLGDTWWATAPPLAFWASPMVHDANLYDFHVVTLVAALLVWCVFAFETSRTRLAWVLLALALACNEDVPLLAALLGLWLALTGRRKLGAQVAVVSVVYWLLLVGAIVPALNQGRGIEKLEGHGNRYGWLGSGPFGIVAGLLKHPLLVAQHLLRPDKLRLPLYLLLSGGVAALFGGWRLLLPLAPQIAAGMLSDLPFNTRLTGTYYWIVSEAFIVLACLYAAEKKRWPLVYLAAVTAPLSLLLSPLPYGAGSSWSNYSTAPGAELLETARAQIPPLASLCVQNNLGAHFSERPAVHAPPVFCLSAQYALLYLRNVGGPDSGLFVRSAPAYLMGTEQGEPPAPLVFAIVRALLLAPEWNLLVLQDGLYLFSRDAPRRVSVDAGVAAYNADLQRFQASVGDLARDRLPWARYLTQEWGWQGAAAASR